MLASRYMLSVYNVFKGKPLYNGRIPILSSTSLNQFVIYMNNLTLPFDFDHAVAVFELVKKI